MTAQERPLNAGDSARPPDPDVLQRRASNPRSSVWVGASAGTGKTKVLTDRVLRLLLPRGAGVPGSPPHKILCLTFTRAGASEMMIRIAGALSRWAVSEEGDEETPQSLRYELRGLLGRPPETYEIRAARQLFASVVDHPGGLPIMTIHAFCQSLLGRFPLEAGLVPHFRVLEEGPAAALLHEARVNVLGEAQHKVGSALSGALERLAHTLNEEQFFNLLSDIQSERRQFAGLLQRYGGAEGLYEALCGALDLEPGITDRDLLRAACDETAFDGAALARAALVLGEGTPATDQPKAAILRRWLAASPAERAASFTAYEGLYFTTTGAPRKDLLTKKLAEKYPEAADSMAREAQRLIGLRDAVNRAACAALSRDLFLMAEAIAARYQALKDRQGALDFDDLILRTLALLKGGLHPGLKDMDKWVNFKLDQGLDHLLVDEAQDTNPEQWEILEALSDEFFSGAGAREGERSVFVVGDHKQSIYSFQRASPREFARMKDYFARRLDEAGSRLDPVNLQVSFRSAPAVLRLVDAVFADEESRKGLGLEEVEHKPHRYKAAGHVEIWPLWETSKPPPKDYWQLPLEAETAEEEGAPIRLARHIADTVGRWLGQGEPLVSRGRPVKPGDIMILLKNRKKGEAIVKALKARGIPVGGADRMVLGEQLAVEDLMAAVQFALLPEDDLTLACLLKSPLIGLGEDALFTLAYGRKGSLWRAIPEGEMRGWLSGLIAAARRQGPYAFLCDLLYKPCPAHGRSGLAAMQSRLGRHALDPLEELLRAAQDFETAHPASLSLFSFWQARQDTEIRREQEGAGEGPGFVRVMTVHGSKGLQAPIVILPDTVRAVKNAANRNERRLLWPHQSGGELPLWSPRKDTDFKAFEEALARLEEAEDEEYRRLLYVALTRAEDRLYIGGAAGSKGAIPESWYHYIFRGFERLEGQEVLEDGTRRYTNPQLGAVVEQAENKAPAGETKEFPAWLRAPLPDEPSPPRPLAPSRAWESEPPARSPLESVRDQVFVRGNLTHKLLQVLPDLASGSRDTAGKAYLARYGAMFGEAVQAEILTETLAVLNHPDFAALFGPGSQAEVPVSGITKGGELLSGQIDRLLVTDEKILIVDYKTNRTPPADPRDIPPLYIRQMQGYAALLSEIYPGREISCALIWTDGPVLMPVAL